MVSVLLISHGDMAAAMVRSAAMLLGRQPRLKGLSLLPSDSAEGFWGKLERAAAKLDCGEGLVILSDFPLGTPFNTALRLQSGAAVQHLTGMSMPMLLAILRDRADPSLTAEKLSERALAAAAKESFSVNQFIKALGEQTL